jgi:hypothetical protein
MWCDSELQPGLVAIRQLRLYVEADEMITINYYYLSILNSFHFI